MGDTGSTSFLQTDWHLPVSGPLLVVKRKKEVIAQAALDRFRITVGRADECDIVLEDGRGVSRRHAQLLVLDGEVVIEDLDSRNGIYVNRKPLKRHTVRPGDRIAIGEYRLQVLYEQGDRLDRPESEGQIAQLMQLWAGAAIVNGIAQCPLCDATDAGDPKPGATLRPEDPACATAEEAEEVIVLTPGSAREPANEFAEEPARELAEESANEPATRHRELRHRLQRRLIRRRRPLRSPT